MYSKSEGMKKSSFWGCFFIVYVRELMLLVGNRNISVVL